MPFKKEFSIRQSILRHFRGSLPGLRVSRRPSCGFTLAEVLVGIFIIGATMAMSANLLVNSSRTSENARQLTHVAFLARNQMDRMALDPAEDFPQQGVAKFRDTEYSWKATYESKESGSGIITFEVNWESIQGSRTQTFYRIVTTQ